MTDRRRRNYMLDELALQALLPDGATVVAVAMYNNPIKVSIIAERPDWEPIDHQTEAPVHPYTGTPYPACAEGNQHGECVLINGHGQGGSDSPGTIPTTPHIDRYGSIWTGKQRDCQCSECGTYRAQQKAALMTTVTTAAGTRPAPGTFIQDTPPRGERADEVMGVRWVPCGRERHHVSHWIETDQTKAIITNCPGRNTDGSLPDIPFR